MSSPTASQSGRRASLVTLGCTRNEVDSGELAGRLTAGGWQLSDDPDSAGVVVVNTCGFVESAKKDSVDTLLAAAGTGAKVVAVGCMAQRYGAELADSMPEADAVLSFDHYPELAQRLDDVVAGRQIAAHTPADRRTLLPITPVRRPAALDDVAVPGHAQQAGVAAPDTPGWGPRVLRTRLTDSPVAALKIASGCDRRCSFCAIPSFRGSFVSRVPDELVAEASWLAQRGARELFLVSENSTSYGKDLGREHGGGRALERLLPRLAAVAGIERVRVSDLQPAELHPALLWATATTEGVADYFDLSFQHASASVLRRMRRFGSTESFLALLEQIRGYAPAAGVRTNVIVGFPGETEDDVEELVRFLTEARMDAVGVFGYSDEDGTEAASLAGKVDDTMIAERVARVSELVEQLTTQRAEERVGETVEVLVETVGDEPTGRAAYQAPEVDGECVLVGPARPDVGEVISCRVEQTAGVDLIVRPVRPSSDVER